MRLSLLLSTLAAVLALSFAGEAQGTTTVTIKKDAPGAPNTEPPYFADFSGGSSVNVMDSYSGQMVTVFDQQTFCVEQDEDMNYDTPYSFTIDGYVSNQGSNVGGVNGQDPLSAQTAFLFTVFATNGWTTWAANLGMAAFTYNGASNASALQNALWFLEQDIQSVSGLAQTYVNAANYAVSSGQWADGIGSVRVLNITQNGTDRQSQLVVVVPEPGSLALAALGLGAFVLRRRRK